jgi:hypothetical protein
MIGPNSCLLAAVTNRHWLAAITHPLATGGDL